MPDPTLERITLLKSKIAEERANLRTFDPWECTAAFDAAEGSARHIYQMELELIKLGVSQRELDAEFRAQRPDIADSSGSTY